MNLHFLYLPSSFYNFVCAVDYESVFMFPFFHPIEFVIEFFFFVACFFKTILFELQEANFIYEISTHNGFYLH